MNTPAAVENLRSIHLPDSGLAHGDVNIVGISGQVVRGSYNLMLPTQDELPQLTSCDVQTLTDGCMDKRQSFELYHEVGGNGHENVVVLKAGGAGTGREDRKRFATDVEFWSTVWQACPAHPLIQLLVHDYGCAWAKKACEPETVYVWQQQGIEQPRMISRAAQMRDAIAKEFRWKFHKPNISLGLVHVVDDQFQHIVWQH